MLSLNLADGAARTATASVCITPVRAPLGLYVAPRTNEIGGVVYAVGPFADETTAKTHVADQFDGHGFAAPFELRRLSHDRP